MAAKLAVFDTVTDSARTSFIRRGSGPNALRSLAKAASFVFGPVCVFIRLYWLDKVMLDGSHLLRIWRSLTASDYRCVAMRQSES